MRVAGVHVVVCVCMQWWWCVHVWGVGGCMYGGWGVVCMVVVCVYVHCMVVVCMCGGVCVCKMVVCVYVWWWCVCMHGDGDYM